MTEITISQEAETNQENDRDMAKTKEHETLAEFLNHVKDEVKKLESCNFEEFRANMISVTGDLYKAMLMTFVYNAKNQKELTELIIDRANAIWDINDDDFKKAERNFKKMGDAIYEFEHRVSKAEAGAICSLMRSLAVLVRLVRGNFISYDEVINPEQEFKLVPKDLKKCIADVFGISQKSMKAMVKKASKVAA